MQGPGNTMAHVAQTTPMAAYCASRGGCLAEGVWARPPPTSVLLGLPALCTPPEHTCCHSQLQRRQAASPGGTGLVTHTLRAAFNRAPQRVLPLRKRSTTATTAPI